MLYTGVKYAFRLERVQKIQQTNFSVPYTGIYAPRSADGMEPLKKRTLLSSLALQI